MEKIDAASDHVVTNYYSNVDNLDLRQKDNRSSLLS